MHNVKFCLAGAVWGLVLHGLNQRLVEGLSMLTWLGVTIVRRVHMHMHADTGVQGTDKGNLYSGVLQSSPTNVLQNSHWEAAFVPAWRAGAWLQANTPCP